MNIKLNGTPRDITPLTTVQQLLAELGLPSEHVVVEINRDILTINQFAERMLQENDELEIVQFVGGG